jgi:hypothetical protein
MRLLLALSGTFLPPASTFAPWGWLSDGRLLVEFPGVADLIGPERSEGPYIAPRGLTEARAVVPRLHGAHPEDIPALCDLSCCSELRWRQFRGELDERRPPYEERRTA